MEEKKPVVHIEARDINGNRYVFEFISAEQCCECAQVISDEYEILLVVYCGFCVYSQLMCGTEITWEDISGFFA